jgi:uncharacterized protein YdeI (YjbR/CyaY-like superfamily)
MQRAKTVDAYLKNAGKWQPELERLVGILRTTKLTEEVKWGAPCYTYRGKNIVGIGGFKSYFGLWFHQGALLTDKNQVLINAQEGVTKALRQWRMSSAKDVKPAVIKRYVAEAIKLAEAGKEIKADRSKPLEIPAPLTRALRTHKGATAAFRGLRIGLQREYADYIAGAKRADTVERRIEKILPMIVTGRGLNDRYR